MATGTKPQPPVEPGDEQETQSRGLKGYFERALERASLRRTPSQFAIVLLGFALIGVVAIALASFLRWLHWYPSVPPPLRIGLTRSKLGEIFLTLSSIFAAVGPGFLLANMIGRFIGPWGRQLDREAGGIHGTDYSSSQRGLIRLSAVTLAAASPLFAASVLLGR
jgi:hypothetical protein